MRGLEWPRSAFLAVCGLLLVMMMSSCQMREPDLSEDILMNMEYRSACAAQGAFRLRDGEYAEPGVSGASSGVVVSLEDYVIGHVNGVPVAAVILKSASGGSGVFYDLAVVMKKNGTIVNTDQEYIGDRVKIRGIDIRDGAIVLDMVTHGPEEPLCCPTVSWKQRYLIRDGGVVRPGADTG